MAKKNQNGNNVRLALWSGNFFTGRRIVFRREGVAVRDLRAFRFNNLLSSFRLRGGDSDDVTLVLFSGFNFQGSFRVFRGNERVRNLSNVSFNNVTSSFILVERNLSDSEIQNIRNTGRPPSGVLVIRQ